MFALISTPPKVDRLGTSRYPWTTVSIFPTFILGLLFILKFGDLLEQKALPLTNSLALSLLADTQGGGHHPRFSRASTSGVEFHDMHLDDGSLGGTVFGLHNGCLSRNGLHISVDTDNNTSCQIGLKLKNDTGEGLLRVYSNYHSFHVPTWLQFGEQDVYLYLSQRASAAEEGWRHNYI
jgi:hypothetical protein